MTANLLRKRLPPSVDVVLVGEGLRHVFQPANLDVAFKGVPPGRHVRDERALLVRGIRHETTGAARIETARDLVVLRDGRELAYDALVIATGATADPSAMTGLAQAALNFHTGPEDSARIWDALKDFHKGRVVVAISSVPYKCPPSPVEAVFLLDELFRSRGERDAVEVRLVSPYPRAYPAGPIADVVEPRLEEKGIRLTNLFNMEGVDTQERVIYSLEGEEVPYDLLIAIPPHRGAEVIRASPGLGDEEGFVPTDKETMRVAGLRNVFALGDATNIPISKSGVVAHLAAEVVAENLTRLLEGEPGEVAFDGRINCPMEVGGRKALFVSATYTSPAQPQHPNTLRYLMKKSFARIYWHTLRGGLEWMFAPYFGPTHHEKGGQP